MKTTKNKAVYESDLHGEGKVTAIVFPESFEELETLVRISQQDIIPRGSNTSLVGACKPNNSVIVDMSKMNNILYIDPEKKTVYLEAGVRISELQKALEKYGLEFPLAPLLPTLQTFGGVIATNSLGARDLKYGNIKNWIEYLEVVDGSGKTIVNKSDIEDFVGLEGITGIIVRAKLRVTTKKERTLTIYRSDSIEELIEAGKRLKLDHEVSLLYLLGKHHSLLHGLESKYHLFVEFESSKGKMKSSEYKKFINLLGTSYHVLASGRYSLLEDPRFFLDKLARFIDFIEEKKIPYFCNLGSGVVYAAFKPEESEKLAEVREEVRRMRGKISAGLGIGIVKKQYIEQNDKEIIKRIKTRHDPLWKFNQNKVIDYESPVLSPQGITTEKVEEPEKVHKTAEEEIKTAEEEMEVFIQQERVKDVIEQNKVEDMQKMVEVTGSKRQELTEEEKEEIKRIAGGYFGEE